MCIFIRLEIPFFLTIWGIIRLFLWLPQKTKSNLKATNCGSLNGPLAQPRAFEYLVPGGWGCLGGCLGGVALLEEICHISNVLPASSLWFGL